MPVVVLDRPNPIGGAVVAGPVRDAEFASFIAYHALPVRHGMTVGELARLFNAERKIGAKLTVIPCEGWRGADIYDRTGLVWVNPSPNMRSLTEALLYPGRRPAGGDQPGDRPGDRHAVRAGRGPLDRPAAFAAAPQCAGVPGVRFVPVRFTPRERQYAGKRCGGVQIIVTDWCRFDRSAWESRWPCSSSRCIRTSGSRRACSRLLADRATYRGYPRRQAGRCDHGPMGRPSWRSSDEIRERYLLYR